MPEYVIGGMDPDFREELYAPSASVRTGGYGHGRAVDVTSTDEDAKRVCDAHGAKFGLGRPMPGTDPGHIQSGSDRHKVAAVLRQARIKSAQINVATTTPRAKLFANVSR
jgi:hypothetical protein